MNISINIDWKFALALGADVVFFLFAMKMDSKAAGETVNHAIDCCHHIAASKTAITAS